MASELTWLGHGCWLIETASNSILLDPFLNDSPTAPLKSSDVQPDHILLSHGHFDHVADAAEIANRTGATILAMVEVANWFESKHDVKNVIGMNIGGSVELPFGRVKMTSAVHSSSLPDGTYGGNPAGFVLSLSDGVIYFACDTALFGDMQLIAPMGIDLAVLPIGDHFTMGPDDAVAAVKLVNPKRVAPAHYNTWPPIEQDPVAWADKVREQTNAEPVVLQPGEKLGL